MDSALGDARAGVHWRCVRGGVRSGACDFELHHKVFYAMLSLVELSTLGLSAEPKDFYMFADSEAVYKKFKRERRDCRRAMRAQYDRAA